MTLDRVLVVGVDGLVGGALAAHLRRAGTAVVGTTRRPGRAGADTLRLDLADPHEVADALLPEVDGAVIAAACARIGDCARDPDGSRRVNVDGSLALAERLRRRGAQVIYLSSDKVFDGTVPHRRREEQACPETEYGRQKAAAEAALLRAGDGVAVLRLSKVLSPTLELLHGWARDLAAERPITPFEDLYLAPVAIDDVCRLLERLLAERAAGLFHLSGAEDRSYVALARALARSRHAEMGLVQPVRCDPRAHPPAARPPHSTLDMSLEAERFDVAPPPFDSVAARVLKDLG